MKYLRLLAMCGLAVWVTTACQEKTFTVKGTITDAADSTLYFANVGLKGLETLDSVRLDADGRFSFSEKAPEAPDFYVLRIGGQIINIAIDSTETVTVCAAFPRMAADYEVEGSENCIKIRQLALMQQDLLRLALSLEKDYSLSRTEARDSLQRMVDAYKKDVAQNYIFTAPHQTPAYFALLQTLGQWLIFDPQADGIDDKAYRAVATSWNTFYPEAQRTKNLYSIVEESINRRQDIALRNNRQLDDSQIIESGVIDLSLVDNHGQEQTLTGLKGQVVLLDFHSFAMKDSPQRILMLRDLYNKYHTRGLEIYQVSIDADEHFWKQMTRELPWISVRDAEGASAVRYNVLSVPEYFLIDRQNQLQKRGEQIKNLDKEIENLLSFRP